MVLVQRLKEEDWCSSKRKGRKRRRLDEVRKD
jgi:hypothetical protein